MTNQWLEGVIGRDGGKSWLFYREGSGGTVEILDIHVDENSRRRGTGREMIEALKELLRRDNLLIFAITRVSNVAACQFYEALGFRIVGRLHQFYRVRDDMKDGADGYHHGVMYGLDI